MTVKICPECEAENPASEEICMQCSFPLETIAASGSANTADLRCGNCGQSVTEAMKFCDGCGINLGEQAQASAGEDDIDPPPVFPDVDETLESEQGFLADPAALVAQPGDGFKLSVVEGFSLGKEYLLFKTEMMVGRLDREGNIFPDIDLEDQDDGYVSRQHAILRHEKGQVTVEDLGTENGTTVDNRPIPAHKPLPLVPGQVLRLGKVGLMLKLHKSS